VAATWLNVVTPINVIALKPLARNNAKIYGAVISLVQMMIIEVIKKQPIENGDKHIRVIGNNIEQNILIM